MYFFRQISNTFLKLYHAQMKTFREKDMGEYKQRAKKSKVSPVFYILSN